MAAFECDIARISFPDDPVTDLSFHEQRLAKFVNDLKAGAFVAEDITSIIGWALVTQRENFATKERYGDFRSLYVVETHRRSRVAAALMRAVLDFCVTSNLASVVGRTSFANDAMTSIYVAYGFKPKHISFELQIAPEAATRLD